MESLLSLFVVVPLLAGAAAAILPWRWARDTLHIAVPALSAVAGGLVFAHTAANGTIAHNIGLFPGGVAIPFAADAFTGVMLVTTGLVAATANWFATANGDTRSQFYPALSQILITGVNGALLTADLFNFFVFIEVMLLPSYGLIAMTGTWSRLASARMFVVINLAASTMLVVGVAFVYSQAGTVNIAALEGAAAGGGPVTVAMGLVIIAVAAKAGVFPVHTWLPRTYPGTSAAVMGLFSALHTKVAVYMLFRIYTTIFDLDDRWNTLIVVVMVASMLVGSLAGLAENSIRRVIAYQMVNGMPFILVVLAFTSGNERHALAAGVLYMVHHMVTVGGLILASGAIEETYGTGLIKRLSGLMRREPLIAAIVAAGSFSVVGLPPFSGLWGKVLVVGAVAEEASWRSWLVIVVIVVASFAALLAMLRVWRKAFWGHPMQDVPENLRIKTRLIWPSLVLIAVSAGMFVFAGPLVEALLTATDGLLDTANYVSAVLGDSAAMGGA
ncbi:monovalent cation/H+ antiporter subunit D family protein [Corynebacterium otitidis]|uniref:Multicomponent Na+:H+ antiporter subunit D n=1 Tax=Corynebacterium otitidis ATCC 51513 TaxID=883169 RepID=I7LCA0_9CORY|nr:monovalent cation/H+ antiporter subunit D family protein [Corynebacterium otitidis]EJZ81763.1 hypothetical protein HMPREF9719_01280 [Corynebacterium otitidis ATCC 51513]KKO84273.1 cation:proton antiporter [Corynebacterium otitidis]CCI83769.1 multicomponent Na+:H+ antiporter subunit D [Corynebacterium otitidis ATCC 51513]